jgi:hypothetical protein
VVAGDASRAQAPQPGLLARHADKVSGPLADLAAGYVARLAGRGYASSSVRQHPGLMADLSAWLGEQGLGPGEVPPSAADRFAARAGSRRTYLATARSLIPLLEYLRGAGVLPEPSPGPEDARALLLAGYRRAGRGLAVTTIRDYVMYAPSSRQPWRIRWRPGWPACPARRSWASCRPRLVAGVRRRRVP